MTQQSPSTPEAGAAEHRQSADTARKRHTGQLIPLAIGQSFVKLNPRTLAHNPVMFVVEIGSVICTYYFIRQPAHAGADTAFSGSIAVWLWFTVLFANFAEAMAEGRGKAQADTLRRMRTETTANLITDGDAR